MSAHGPLPRQYVDDGFARVRGVCVEVGGVLFSCGFDRQLPTLTRHAVVTSRVDEIATRQVSATVVMARSMGLR